MKYILAVIMSLSITGCAAMSTLSLTSVSSAWSYKADRLTSDGELVLLQKARMEAYNDLNQELNKRGLV